MDEADYSFLLSLLLESLKNPVGIFQRGFSFVFGETIWREFRRA